jgi:polar amino acid transport system ATP-binding protein
MISFKNVSKKYNNRYIFQNLSFEIAPNSSSVIIGQSGLGKTTICKIIAGIESFDEGEIEIDGSRLNKKNLTQIRKKVGFIFQDFNLFHNLNVIENILYAPIKVYKSNKIDAEKRADEFFKRFSLDHSIKERAPKDLSGGQKQRIAIIRALMFKPKILIFDEPTASLDYALLNETANIINELKTEMSIITITHDFIFAKKICDNLLYFDQNRQIQSTSNKADFLKKFEV